MTCPKNWDSGPIYFRILGQIRKPETRMDRTFERCCPGSPRNPTFSEHIYIYVHEKRNLEFQKKGLYIVYSRETWDFWDFWDRYS